MKKKLSTTLILLTLLASCSNASFNSNSQVTSQHEDSQSSSSETSQQPSSETPSSENPTQLELAYDNEGFTKTINWPSEAVSNYISSRYQEYVIPQSPRVGDYFYKATQGVLVIETSGNAFDQQLIDTLNVEGWTIIEMLPENEDSYIVAGLDERLDVFVRMELLKAEGVYPDLIRYTIETAINYDNVNYEAFFAQYQKHEAWPIDMINNFLIKKGVTDIIFPDFTDANNGFYTREVIIGQYTDLQLVIDTPVYPLSYLNLIASVGWTVNDWSEFGYFGGTISSPNQNLTIEYYLSAPDITGTIPVPATMIFTFIG